MHQTDLTCSAIMRLKAVPPYDIALTLHKPAGWSLLTPFEIFEHGTLWTAMRTPSGSLFGLKLTPTGTVENPALRCEVYSRNKLAASEKTELSKTITWMLNLNEDISEFYALAKRDPLVRVLVKDLYGMRNTKHPDIFSRLILAVTLQMAPIARSDQMMTLLIKQYGDRIRFNGKQILYWPSPSMIANADTEELKQKCKLGYRAKPLKSIAESLQAGFPSLQQLEETSAQEAKAKLMELQGVGEYSADIVSPHPGFALDVWSAKIFSILLLGKKAESPRDLIPRLRKIGEERWGRWKGYIFVYVLHDLNNLSKKFKSDFTQT